MPNYHPSARVMRLVRLPCAIVLALAGVIAVVPQAGAMENGGFGNFPVGAQTVGAAFLPPPGATEFYGYVLWYAGTSLRDGQGHSAAPGFRADVFAQAPRLVHTWTVGLGPIHLSSGVVIETDYIKVKLAGQRDEDFNLDLLGLEPFDFTTSVGNWHFMLNTELYVPLGGYDRTRLANSSNHFYSLAEQFAVTWTPTPRWDLSLNPDIELHMRNRATGYRSGHTAGLTWGLNYRPFQQDLRWQFGLGGFYLRQIEADHLQGQPVPGGYKVLKNALGPQVVYWFSPAAVVIVKWQHEVSARNTSRGDLYWLEFALPL